MRVHNKEKVFLLLGSDLIAMLAAFVIALALGHKRPMSMNLFWHYGWGLLALISSVVIVFIILDVYSLRKMSDRLMQQIFIAGWGLLFSSILVTFIFFFFGKIAIPRAVFLIFFLFSLVFIAVFRYFLNKVLKSFVFWRILIVGKKKASEEMALLINRRKYLHSQVVGYMSDEPDADSSSVLDFMGKTGSLARVAEKENIDQVIVTYKKIEDELMKLLLGCMRKKIKVMDFKKVMEGISWKVPVDYLDANWVFRELMSTADRRYFWYAKRFIDIILSMPVVCILLLFLPIIALLIKLDSKGPIFYSQLRVGRGKHFRIWKFRTMIADADRGNVYWTLEKDSRITRIGRFLRKVRLDEIPQVVNIIKGDMSFVGPRPEAVSLSEMYAREIPHYNERHMVNPGITGWAQINYRYGNSIEDAKEKLKYDLYYIKNRGIMLDMLIFLRTIYIVLTGKGAI